MIFSSKLRGGSSGFSPFSQSTTISIGSPAELLTSMSRELVALLHWVRMRVYSWPPRLARIWAGILPSPSKRMEDTELAGPVKDREVRSGVSTMVSCSVPPKKATDCPRTNNNELFSYFSYAIFSIIAIGNRIHKVFVIVISILYIMIPILNVKIVYISLAN